MFERDIACTHIDSKISLNLDMSSWKYLIARLKTLELEREL